jgi:hypothetical protein
VSFTQRYSESEREALAAAFVDSGIRPARRVVELAARGELEWRGTRLPPFATSESTVRSLAGQLRRRRAGELRSGLVSVPTRNAVETLRRRLVNVADAGLAAIERGQGRRGGKVDSWEELRQAARAVREIVALPEPEDPRPPVPGASVNGRRREGATRGGLAGAILKAARRDVATDAPPAVDGDVASAPPSPDAAWDPAADVVADLRRRLEAIAEQEPDPCKHERDASAI